MKKKIEVAEKIYGQAVTNVPKELADIITNIPLYESYEETTMFRNIGYSPKHKIMRIRFGTFDDYPFDYAYANIDPELFAKVDNDFGANRLRYDIMPYMSKYPCYKLDASNLNTEILKRPEVDESIDKNFEMGAKVFHRYYGNGVVTDVEYYKMSGKKRTFYGVKFEDFEGIRFFASCVLT